MIQPSFSFNTKPLDIQRAVDDLPSAEAERQLLHDRLPSAYLSLQSIICRGEVAAYVHAPTGLSAALTH